MSHCSVRRYPCTGSCRWGDTSASCSKGGTCARVWKFHRGGLNQGGIDKCGGAKKLRSDTDVWPLNARGLNPSASPWTQWPKASWHIGRSASMKAKGSIAGIQDLFPTNWRHTMDSPGIFGGHRQEMFKMITVKTANNATITSLITLLITLV